MGKSLLSIIAENERIRIQEKNLKTTDDVQNSPYKEYGNSFGEFAAQVYTKDTNKESPSVNEVGDERLLDTKELNVFPQEEYIRVNTDLNDASVIDMPEIDEISEVIYRDNLVYNKFVTFDYIPYEFQDAKGINIQVEDYGSYIAGVKRDLEVRGFTLADIFLGDFNNDDSPIGVIGGQALNNALNEQFATNLKRETLGRVNTNAFSVLQTGELFRPDYDITVSPSPLVRTAEFLAGLQGAQTPLSYLPPDVFGLERIAKEDNGNVTYVGSNLTFEERASLLLQYTGKGQQTHLFNLLKLNLYNPKMEGKFETLQRNSYIADSGMKVGNPNANDFIVTFSKSVDSGRGAYEPYGVVGITKRTNIGKMFSDKFAWQWMDDVANPQAIGWVNTGSSNRFDSKSLLFKTQDIINKFSEGEVAAFLDMSDKEFVEVINGETNIISRGDATTASGDYVDDDGTQVNKGDFFRVWTKNRGYNRLSRTLRHRGLDNGDTRSVLNDNGLINFAPTVRTATSENGLGTDDVIKRYMFSLENLAWADNLDDLPLCEQGAGDPVTGTSGRIMWFPPYDLKLEESVDVNWTATEFMGRGEPVFTYNNTTRSASLSWSIIVDHPDIVHKIVGEKTEFWERYFKGDKLVEDEARTMDFLSKRLSQNELDEIQKRRLLTQPIVKVNDNVNISEERKDEEEEKRTKEIVDNDGIGTRALAIYFPNNETTVPRSPFLTSLESIDDPFVVDPNLTFALLKEKNIGYEDGGQTDFFDVVTKDGITVQTSNGIRYIKNNVSLNKKYTYNRGKLIDSIKLCTSIPNAAVGYRDETNYGKNDSFYFQWKDVFSGLLKDATKAKITFVGGASAAIPPQGQTNSKLAKDRAQNAQAWFEGNVEKLMKNLGNEIEFIKEFSSTGDKEDREKLSAGQTSCQDCDNADTNNCKESRRVDIYVQILEATEPEPEPVVNPTGDTTIQEDSTKEDLNPDADEVTADPDNPVGITPSIDPNILRKLVYTECDFFKYLEINDPIAYQTISERIKYFQPVYHSMTPEGFNSRLNFLHQCTRQGDSIGRDGVDNWKNLAFGRPPVCILRIGDFYHTRIIIESMSINYNEGMTWDLNPEGIGVQPMYVDISLNIKILGGSSMAAPINRLQNALSFNYYANTEMYDVRADSVILGEGDSNGDADSTSLKKGEIVDGIRLSSITNYSDAERQQRLATIRQQSRISLANSTTPQGSTEQIYSTGNVGSLLELKKNLGMPLTEEEKIEQKTVEDTSDKFISPTVSEQTTTEVRNILNDALNSKNSNLNAWAQEYIDSGVSSIEGTSIRLGMETILVNSVTNSSELTDSYLDQTTIEYIGSYTTIQLSSFRNTPK